MTPQHLEQLIRQGEGVALEFKQSREKLNRDVYETICAFLNRHGGTVLLGVADNGAICGVEPDAVARIKADLITALHNTQKINPPMYLAPEEVTLDGCIVLALSVPESSQVHTCNGRIFDRNEDGEGDLRISLRDRIFREVVANMLIHREYMNPFPAKLIIHRDHVSTENSNNPHQTGLIDPVNFSPSPKNPVIARMFKEIERAEELGSGVRNLFRYGKAFAGYDPALQEDQIFRVTVAIPSFMSIEGATTAQVTQQVTQQVRRDERVLEFCRIPRSRSEIQFFVGMRDREHFRSEVLQPLLEKGAIAMTIPDKPNSSKQRYITTSISNPEEP